MKPELGQSPTQHLKPLEHGHRERQVPLGRIQLLDVGGHGGNRFLGAHGPCAHGFDILEQFREVRLCRRDSCERVGIRGGLGDDKV